MIEIDLNISSEIVRPLFDESVIDSPRLFSALKRQHKAAALVDSDNNPRWCVIRSSWFGCTYIGGEINREELETAILKLREKGEILLSLSDNFASIYPSDYTKIERRIAFYNRQPNDPAFDKLITAVPSNLRVERITRNTFERCLWRNRLVSIYGTTENYLEHSIGYLLLDGNRILSEAHAFFWGDTMVEIGVITADGYRSSGYASIVSAHLVRACEERDYLTYWGCSADHPASIAVARKIGYRIEREYSNAYYPAI